ncbi:MAG: sugar phosphate isomerase/epimerase [Clostridia bacterium]|nr:sugar phosphate isomerase/epimerase [Clostridia bacterium]
MLLSIDTISLRQRYNDETALKMIKDAGFDAYDYSMFRANGERDMLDDDYIEKAHKLRAFADEIGLLCRQAHAPFDFTHTDTFDITNLNYLRIVRSMEVASILGATNIVVHAVKKDLPDNFDFYGFHRKFYRSFIPYCEKIGIKICVENLVGREKITLNKFPVFSDPVKHIEFVKSLESDWFNICVDVGHSELLGYRAHDVIRTMNSEIFKVTHISDNDLTSDLHYLPYEGKLNWDEITSAFAEIGFCGDFSFELEGYLNRQKDEEVFEALKLAEKTGRQLINKIKKGL